MTGSLVKFKGGDIAGWTITSNVLTAGNVTLDSSGIINVGNLSGVGDINDVRTGFRVENNGEVLIKQGGANSNYIRFDNGFLDINTTSASLSGSSVEILTPSFFLGSATNNISSSDDDLSITTKNLTASGSSVEIQSPNFFLGSATSHISGSSTGLIMSSSEFRLDSTNLDIDSVAQEIRLNGITLQGGTEPFIDVNNKIRIDTDGTLHKINSVGKDTFTDTTAGFFLAVDGTTPKVNIGDVNNKLSFDGTKFEISSSAIKLSGNDVVIDTQNLTASGSNVEIITPSFFFGDKGTSFISSSGTQLRISSSNFSLENGNVTASNVQLSGSIKAESGDIGGFDIDSISISDSGDNLILSSSGQITGSKVLFKGGTIGGFTIAEDKLSSGTVSLDSTLQSLIVKDSLDRTIVTVGDRLLSEVTTSTENLVFNSGFEDGVDGYFTSSTHTTGDTLFTLGGHGNTRVISVDVSTTDPNTGSKHYRISVGGSIRSV